MEGSIMTSQHRAGSSHGRSRAYAMLWINMAVSLFIMYIVMFSMIDGWGDFRNNLNMLYMAVTMWAPMGILMLLTMPGMYNDRRINLLLVILFAALTIGSFWATRSQALIGDEQFVKSMIPHHSGAILMCSEAPIADAELRQLCDEIIAGQRREIEQMQAIGARLRQAG
jgi:uncharacterized protein (DUF305 family)